MALSKVKFRLCLLAFTLFLACVSVGLGVEGASLGSGVGADNECVNGCGELQGKNVDEFAACAKRCGVNQKVSEICRQWCQVAEKHGAEQQRRCRQACEERLREQEQGEDVEDKWRDPEREREEQRWREHEREERRRREHEREHERGRGRFDGNERDPEREREERRREEQRREHEQRRREQERRGEREDEDGENQRDPDWRKEQERHRREQEQERRERQRRGEREDEVENQRDPDWRREQERRRREQEQERRERQRRGEREDEVENQRDPDWRREQERRRKEQEQERRERQRRGEREDEDENQRDPDWRREQERRRREQEQERRERQQRGEREDEDENQRDPDWRREQERREQEQRRREQEQREREWEREHGRRGSRDENQRGQRGREEERSREEERKREERQRERQHGGRSRVNQFEPRWTEQSHNPYYFQEQRFQSRFRSDQGYWRVLERFSERTDLLKRIKNQRLAILEARPQTFIIPHHLDAESVLFVVRGRATITTIVQEKRETRKESYNVERGDVITIPAGTTVYLANQENEDLQIVKLIQPVNNPGEFKDYLSGGGEAQAYYSVFSNDVLEAALNIPRDRLERIFKQKSERRGKIVRASQEQLRALSQRATSVRKGGKARAVIKLESQTPVYSNQYGQMFEACPDEFPQLRRTDVATSVLDIKQGGMMVPHFNSKATWVVFVSEGTGSFEMGCPHIQGGQWQRGRREEERQWRREEEREGEERSGRIERVAGRLSQGGVLVIPAGHPIAIMASPNENLRLVGFGINAENNQRNFLAGRENIMNEVDREAKELAFNIEGKQAEEIFKSQKESFFTEGPEGGRRRSTERSPLLSILKLAGYV